VLQLRERGPPRLLALERELLPVRIESRGREEVALVEPRYS